MENWTVLLHTGITIIGIVAMVAWARINPVIALVVGALYWDSPPVWATRKQPPPSPRVSVRSWPRSV